VSIKLDSAASNSRHRILRLNTDRTRPGHKLETATDKTSVTPVDIRITAGLMAGAG
jgi:hypothetical protein